MILSDRTAVSHKIVTNPFSATTQTQLCGFDPILKRVMLWISSGTIDLDNTHRKTANKTPIPIQRDDTG